MSEVKRKKKPLSAKLIALWHPILNGTLTTSDVSGGSRQNICWRHYDRKWKIWHKWEDTPKNMSRIESCCPICTGKRLVVGINDLKTRNPRIAKMWHPTLNRGLTARMVVVNSKKKIWWRHYHKATGIWHEWPAKIISLTGKNPTKCSVCDGKRIQVGANDLATTHPKLVSEWHPIKNKKLTPQMVTKCSSEEVWWQKYCLGVRHEWHAMPASRTSRRPQGCAVCRGLQVQRGVNDLASQYPDIAKEWDKVKNKNLTPTKVSKGSKQKVFWKHYDRSMRKYHNWFAVIADRTGAKRSGCPECTKRGFNSGKPAHVYILPATINNTQVIQFGISNDVKARLSDHSRSGFTKAPVVLIPFYKGSKARNFELSLLNLMKEYEILSCNKKGIKFSGSTEAFCLEDADEEFLEEFKELVGF